MRLIILGAGGFLGTKLNRILSEKYDVFPYYYEKEPKLDITDKAGLIEGFRKIRPDMVINAAGLTNVDLCETNKELAEKINVGGTKNIVEACNEVNATLLHFSTGFVFDGKKGNYSENDKPNPVNYYGLTKFKAEEIIKNRSKDYLILRVEVLYGYNGDNSERSFIKWLYDSLKENKKVNVVTDLLTTPTLTDDIAFAVNKIINKKVRGIFHVAGSQKMSRYDMAIKLTKEFSFNTSLINPVNSEELNLPAKRPLDTSLSTLKLNKLGIVLHTFDEGIKIMKEMMLK